VIVDAHKPPSSPVPRVGVVGCGAWGKNLVRNFHALGALSVVCDASPAALEEAARLCASGQHAGMRTTSSVDELLTDQALDALVIAAPAAAHGTLVDRALRAGKDVFVEKPLCLDPIEGRALVKLAAERGCILMVGHLLWYHPAVLKLKQLIDTGDLGRVQYIYSTRLNLGRFRREENILWSFAPHDVSVILGLVGEMPDRVQADAGHYLHERISDVTTSLLSFPSGTKAHIFVSWLHPFKEQKLVVVGDKQMAVFDDGEPERKLVLYPHSITWKNQVPVALRADARVVPVDTTEPLRAECQHFLDRVRDRARPRTDGEEALRVLLVLDRCQRATVATTAPAIAPSPAPTGSAAVTPPRAYRAHESAFIDDGVSIGEGTTIWHVSHLMKGTRIGKHCRIGQNVVIGPDVTVGDGVKIQNNVSVYTGVTLEDDVFCGPSMVFTNVVNPRSEIVRMDELKATLVRRGATLGANCTIVCGTTVGRYAFVAAGAVVSTNVPDYALMIGVPARRTGWMCRCGVKLASLSSASATSATCTACERSYVRAGEVVREASEVRP
jgi:UDP-2-acetamido-3-amino-2,3-dideoxy-glucuronate N-acetyltransferase